MELRMNSIQAAMPPERGRKSGFLKGAVRSCGNRLDWGFKRRL
jgi:hypothetical protein